MLKIVPDSIDSKSMVTDSDEQQFDPFYYLTGTHLNDTFWNVQTKRES